jgi:hypothetical protein
MRKCIVDSLVLLGFAQESCFVAGLALAAGLLDLADIAIMDALTALRLRAAGMRCIRTRVAAKIRRHPC